MNKSSKAFVGMDVHKESIDWAIAALDGEVRTFGRTGGDLNAVVRTVRKLVRAREEAVAMQRQPRHRLQALRGVRLLHAVHIVAELGDLTRFGAPRHGRGRVGLSTPGALQRRREPNFGVPSVPHGGGTTTELCVYPVEYIGGQGRN